jgi:malonyl-CoA O-methyltransferase
MTRKESVAGAFGAAAGTYESAAQVQIRAADRLVELVDGLGLPAQPTVMEVGCGTGVLTRRLLPKLGGDWLVTDLSPAMVETAQAGLTAPKVVFRTMDGEHPDVPTGLFDLVVSNLAAQWFHDLGRALNRLLACLSPGGTLALSTLGAGSFAQWRMAHERLGLTAGTPPYPTAAELSALLPTGARIISETIEISHPDAHAFLDSLRRIGATVPAAGHAPLTPGQLRRVMRSLGTPAIISYELLFILVRV